MSYFPQTINCGPNLIFQSFLLLITDYYSVQFPYLLTFAVLRSLQCLLTFSLLFSAQKFKLTGRVNIVGYA